MESFAMAVPMIALLSLCVDFPLHHPIFSVFPAIFRVEPNRHSLTAGFSSFGETIAPFDRTIAKGRTCEYAIRD